MITNTISATLLEASKGLMLDSDSFSFVGFNAKGILENLRFGNLARDKSIGTVLFTINEVDETGKTIGSKRKWAYAAYLENVLNKTGDDYVYDGKPVQIIDGEVSKLATVKKPKKGKKS